jgi:hypothetical protein
LTYNEAVLLGESGPPAKSAAKSKAKKKGTSSGSKKGGSSSAKAAALQKDRKRRKVVPTEWAPENVFDIIRTFAAASSPAAPRPLLGTIFLF